MTKVIEASLPAEMRSVRVARELCGGLQGIVLAESIEDLKLMISETVTNCIRHAGLNADGSVSVKIIVEPKSVRTEVTDHGKGFKHEARSPEDTGSRGWGMEIVARISSRWGVISNGETKVWFEIDLAA